MTTHDTINAIFEAGGACFLCLNIRRLLKDKSVKGVSLITTTWWTAWGFWNVYFYAAVSCALSFWAGLAVVCANFVWLGLAVHFASVERQAKHEAQWEILAQRLGLREPGCRHSAYSTDGNGAPLRCVDCGEAL